MNLKNKNLLSMLGIFAAMFSGRPGPRLKLPPMTGGSPTARIPFRHCGGGIVRRWTPLTTAETERKIDMAREDAEQERIIKARAKRERKASQRAMQRAA